MSVLLQSLVMVAIAETGDKTQLLSIILAARYRAFLPVLSGMLVATIANHALAAWLGSGLGSSLDPRILKLCVSVTFILLGLWSLIPDTSPEMKHESLQRSAFVASLVAFFLAEMADKTQLATITLAARYKETLQVVAGTTLGMLAANIPAIAFGEKLLARLPLKTIRRITAIIFIACGVWGLQDLIV